MNKQRTRQFEMMVLEMLEEGNQPTPTAVAPMLRSARAMEFDVADTVMTWADEEGLVEPIADRDDESALLSRAMGKIHAHIAAMPQVESISTGRRFDELVSAAGLRLSDIGAATGLDAVLIGALAARRFDPDTIPARLTRTIAGHLGLAADTVLNSLRQPPRAMAGVLPGATAAEQEDFAIAVQASSLSHSMKEELLARHR